MDSSSSICAIVVAYNRKNLLLECLDALLKQSCLPQCIYIIDNASTDGTPEMLKEKCYIKELPMALSGPAEHANTVNIPSVDRKQATVEVRYVRLHINAGGAGGFYEGIKRAYNSGFDWFWLMDDDTVPSVDALKELVGSPFFMHKDTGLLCSHVILENGEASSMNVPATWPRIKIGDKDYAFNSFIDKGAILIVSCSFVSTLVSRYAVTNVGFPIKQMYIWCDDVEYTYRIGKKYKSYYIPASLVVHKMFVDIVIDEKGRVDVCSLRPERLGRIFYDVRNKTFYYRKTNKLIFIKWLVVDIPYMIKRSCYRKEGRLISIGYIFKGMIAGLFFFPKIEMPTNRMVHK